MKTNKTAMKHVLRFLLVAAVLALSSSALAQTTGREAVGLCIDSTASGARCAWSVNDKGEIDVCNKNGCVHCPSADGQCAVTKRVTRTPKLGLPVGTIVVTEVGTFEVTERVTDMAEHAQRSEETVWDRVLSWLSGAEEAPRVVLQFLE